MYPCVRVDMCTCSNIYMFTRTREYTNVVKLVTIKILET